MSAEEKEQNSTGEEGPSPEVEDIELLRDRLKEAEREQGQFRGMLQRMQAESLNYKRRVEEEREEIHRRANADMVLRLLPILDDYEQVLKNAPDVSSSDPWVAGAQMVYHKLRGIMESLGVTRIVALGKSFDPMEHEAVLHEVRDDQEEDKVASVVREGYRLHGRVLRPAQVVVSKRAEGKPPHQGGSDSPGKEMS
ncbi:MAG: GrpE protein [Dehalococcoidia bacterium]|nr:GrpE protein [Dehalococcoidia bacterium]